MEDLIITYYILRVPFLICLTLPHYFVGLVSVGDLVLLLDVEREWEPCYLIGHLTPGSEDVAAVGFLLAVHHT